MTQTRDSNGKFIRVNHIWTPKNMDNGYVDANGRYRVYLPTHHRASSGGYVLRAIVHYEHYNNEKVGIEWDIHHKDKNRLNDSKDNLEKIDHIEHCKLHNQKVMAKRICVICKKGFNCPCHKTIDS